MRKETVKSVQGKCDKLLTPIIRLTTPYCELCGAPTYVAHHHVHKSMSLRLRYEFSNLIALCKECHCKLHGNEGLWASKVVEKRGLEWFKYLEKLGEGEVKADIHYFRNIYQILSEKYHELSTAHTFIPPVVW